MRIALVGIYYPVAILRYFEAALRRRSDVELVTIGPATGDWIPWGGGMDIKRFIPNEIKKPDVDLNYRYPVKLMRQAEAFLEQHKPGFRPDVWLQIDAGFHLDGKPRYGRNLIVGTDPHCLDYEPARQYADKFFCMQTPYMKPGDEYLPYAYDPIWHRQFEPEELTNEVDAGWVGAVYENRKKLADLMRFNKINVVTSNFGPSYETARDWYRRMKVGINYSSRKDMCARVFELAAMGIPALVNHVPDLANFGFTKHIRVFEDEIQAVTIVREMLDNPVETTAMAQQAAQVIRQPEQTWDARITQILRDA